jgi:hypothetical protein
MHSFASLCKSARPNFMQRLRQRSGIAGGRSVSRLRHNVTVSKNGICADRNSSCLMRGKFERAAQHYQLP